MYIIPSVLFHFLPYWSTENHKYHCTVSLTSINKQTKKSMVRLNQWSYQINCHNKPLVTPNQRSYHINGQIKSMVRINNGHTKSIANKINGHTKSMLIPNQWSHQIIVTANQWSHNMETLRGLSKQSKPSNSKRLFRQS